MTSLESSSDWSACLAESELRPVFVLKHSTRCPISTSAHQEFKAYLAESGQEAYINYVVEDRPVSNQIASDTGVTHASPQAFLLSKKAVQWHASHGGITRQSLATAVGKTVAET